MHQLKDSKLDMRINSQVKEQFKNIVSQNGSTISDTLNSYIFNEIKNHR